MNDHPAGLALAPPAAGGAIDHAAVERAAAELLRALGVDPTSEGLRETPRRMADAYAELLTPLPFRATTFPTRTATTSSSSPGRSPSTRCACTTCSPSTGSRTWAICPTRGSSA